MVLFLPGSLRDAVPGVANDPPRLPASKVQSKHLGIRSPCRPQQGQVRLFVFLWLREMPNTQLLCPTRSQGSGFSGRKGHSNEGREEGFSVAGYVVS